MTFNEVSPAFGLVINCPEIFERPDFVAWLNSSRSTATFHQQGSAPSEWSDTFVLVDTGYEGDSSDMPEDIWKAICDTVYDRYGRDSTPFGNHVCVRLTNLA